MAVFGVATLAAALAPNVETLIALRAVQGVGGALFPLSYAVASSSLPPHRLRPAIGTISAMFGVGSALGFPLFGFVIDSIGWQFLFVGSGAVVVLGGAACALAVRESLPRARQPLDVRGVVGIVLWPSLPSWR